jgi:hypothetical protein
MVWTFPDCWVANGNAVSLVGVVPAWAEAGAVEAGRKQPERERLNKNTAKSKTADFLCMVMSPSLTLGFIDKIPHEPIFVRGKI